MKNLLIRTYIAYGGNTPVPLDVKAIQRTDLWAELAYLFLEHNMIPLTVLFKKGEQRSECIVIITKQDRRVNEWTNERTFIP